MALRAAKVTRETRARLALRVFPALPANLVSRGREEQKALLDQLVLLDAMAKAARTESQDASPNIESRTEQSPLRNAPVNTGAGYASPRQTSILEGAEVEAAMEPKGLKGSKGRKVSRVSKAPLGRRVCKALPVKTVLTERKEYKVCKGQPVCRVSLVKTGQTVRTAQMVKTEQLALKGYKAHKAILARKAMRLYMQTSLPHN